jgi:hypothetical protein
MGKPFYDINSRALPVNGNLADPLDHSSSWYGPDVTKHRDWNLEQKKWELKNLEETKAWIEQRMPQLSAEIATAEAELDTTEADFKFGLENAGISSTLFEEYEAFCESLNPEFGHRGDFSITCNNDHGGSYITYDPTFQIFKDCVEDPYVSYHFRCEASTTKFTPKEHIVEFWPIQLPEAEEGLEPTWGAQYVGLHQSYAHTLFELIIYN